MIIALTGLMGCGKNTVAKLIGGREIAFAEPLKRFCGEVFGFTEDQLYGASSARETPSATFRRPNGEPLTPRFALQTLGTEWGRNCDPDVWAKAGVARALRAAQPGCDCHFADCPSDGACKRVPWHVVITDLRFVNEARLVRAAGGLIWRITREGGAGAHASERDVHSPEMDRFVTHEIDNRGTLGDLALRVSAALEQPPRELAA